MTKWLVAENQWELVFTLPLAGYSGVRGTHVES